MVRRIALAAKGVCTSVDTAPLLNERSVRSARRVRRTATAGMRACSHSVQDAVQVLGRRSPPAAAFERLAEVLELEDAEQARARGVLPAAFARDAAPPRRGVPPMRACPAAITARVRWCGAW
ncbi:hypothetical protein ACU686_26290 [Yinghuangia aomiensis]